MKKEGAIDIIYCAHKGTNKENIGDILSAQAIRDLGGYTSSNLIALPSEKASDINNHVIYGGGGMVRPNFSKREVYKDFTNRGKNFSYSIYGVGINKDILSDDYSDSDMEALKEWIDNAASVTVRDYATLDFINQITSTSVKVAPCPTYSVLKSLSQFDLTKEFSVGVSVSFGHTATYEKYLSEIVGFLNQLILTIGPNNVSILCHDEKDYQYAKERYPEVNACFLESFGDIQRAYGKCESIVSLRGHGVIFAAALNLPCSVIPLCDKLSSLYQYHYNKSMDSLSFNVDFHLDQLQRKVVPFEVVAIKKNEATIRR